jgi:hypothetical protein
MEKVRAAQRASEEIDLNMDYPLKMSFGGSFRVKMI